MFVHFIAVSSSLQGQTDLHSPVQARLVPEQRIEIAWQCQATYQVRILNSFRHQVMVLGCDEGLETLHPAISAIAAMNECQQQATCVLLALLVVQSWSCSKP
jgi:hypothetical protein